MPLTLTQTVAPTVEPVTLDEAKRYLRIDGTEEDSVIEALLLAAREEVEMWTGLQLLTATYVLRTDSFPGCGVFRLPRPPLQSVTSVAYLDSANISQTLATSNYVVDPYSMPGQVLLTSTGTWPGTYEQYNAVVVTYVAGFTLSSIPERAKMAIKLLVADLFEHREAQLEVKVQENAAVCRLLWGLRIVEMV